MFRSKIALGIAAILMSASVTANDVQKPCPVYPDLKTIDLETIWKEQWKTPPDTGPQLKQGPECIFFDDGIRSALTPLCGFNDFGIANLGKFRGLKDSCTGSKKLGEFLGCYAAP